MGLRDFTVYDLIKRNSITFRDRQAWFEADDGRVLTFGQFKGDVDRLAHGLQASGIEKGDRIGVLGKNSLEYFLLYGAAAALGAIILPINWRLSPDEVCFNLNDCEPKMLFVDEEFQGLINDLKERLPSIEGYYNLRPDQGSFLEFGSLMDIQSDFDEIEVNSDDGFVIMHTAAVEGRPRGALLSHANVLCANMQFGYLFHLTSEDVHLNALPLFHVGGLFLALTGLYSGALNVNMGGFDAERAAELIGEKKVSLMICFSPMLSSIIEQVEKKGTDMGPLRAVAGLEAPEIIEKYQEMTGGTFYSMYGQTETSCVVSFGRYNDRPGSAGKPIPMADVRLVDDYDRPVPLGQVGEIAMKGPMIFKGYWNLPEENEYTFREGWHHTGDLGRFDEDGFLWYAGRKPEKELIKPGGENVYPVEVEKVILRHPAVEVAVVFGVPDPKWKEGVKAVCQLKVGQVLQPRELIDFVGERIAGYKKPHYVEFASDLPLLDDGSPDKAKIKKLFGGG